MSIKTYLAEKVQEITGRKCVRCAYNSCGKCYHPDEEIFEKCYRSISRPGFERRPPRYLKEKPKATAKAVEVKPAPLTAEQKLQLEKIKATLQQAEEVARESGLVSED